MNNTSINNNEIENTELELIKYPYLGHYGFDSILRSIIYFSSFINFLNKGVIAFTNRT